MIPLWLHLAPKFARPPAKIQQAVIPISELVQFAARRNLVTSLGPHFTTSSPISKIQQRRQSQYRSGGVPKRNSRPHETSPARSDSYFIGRSNRVEQEIPAPYRTFVASNTATHGLAIPLTCSCSRSELEAASQYCPC